MTAALAELTGTALLIILGNGVVANVVLNKTKGNNSGWLVITFGWAMALFVAVYTCTMLGGSGHLNPAVTLAFTFLVILTKRLLFHIFWRNLPALLPVQ